MLVRDEVLGLLKSRALEKLPSPIKLASGKLSSYYIDSKRLTLHASSLHKVSQLFFAELSKLNPRPTMVAGVSVGGDPLVAGILMLAAEQGVNFEGLLVRKEAKSHGLSSGRAVEGHPAMRGAAVWLLEDVISTGASSLKAAEFLGAEGYELAGIICLVDRQMGGVEFLTEKLAIPVMALFKVEEILVNS